LSNEVEARNSPKRDGKLPTTMGSGNQTAAVGCEMVPLPPAKWCVAM
jgi:hypothetical protein